MSYLERPVFISGYNKSGTTLFLSILDGHPELVVIPEELQFFKYVLYEKDKAKAIREKTGFRMFLPGEDRPEWTQGRTWFREGYPEFDHNKFNQLFERAIQESKSFKDLLLRMVQAFTEVDGIDPACTSHWITKTPMEEIFFPVMLKMFGEECKFIYVVRDPRDVYSSIVKWRVIVGKQGNQDPLDAIRFCVYWHTRLKQVLHEQERHENIRIYRYEDLLQETEKTLRSICEFLQIEFSTDLLQPTRHGKPWGGNSAYSGGFNGLSKAPIGRFRETLDPTRTALIERLLWRDMAFLGYTDSGYTDSSTAQEPKGEYQPVPWREYRAISLKYQLRYLLNKHYIRLRYNFPQLH